MINTTAPVVKNFLIELEEIFESDGESKRPHSSPIVNQDYLNADDVYRKLGEEIVRFRTDVREILSEIHPIKNELIHQIYQII